MNTLPQKSFQSARRLSLLGLACFSLLASCKGPEVKASADLNQPGIERSTNSSTPSPNLAPVTSITPAQAQQPVAQLSQQDWEQISTWEGTWKTSYGEMTLQESSPYSGQGEALTKVDGTYDTDSGKIDAVIYDTALTGYWIETSSARKCSTQRQGSFYWGRINFTKDIPNPDTFTGKWGYCEEEATRQWSGERIAKRPANPWQTSKESQPSVQALWQGNWNTSEGAMNLQFATDGQDDTILSGSYSQDGGRIEGYVQEYILNGYWAENSSAQRCSQPRMGTYYWGRIRFFLNDAGSDFSGKWSYCDAEPSSTWTGSRT